MKRIFCLLPALCLLLSLCACAKPAPKEEPAAEETGISFTAKDVDSRTVLSASLFGKAKVTMLYLWTSWSSTCLRDLPDLQELSQEYLDRDAQVVGIMLDGASDSALDAMRKAGVTFTVLLPSEDMGQLLSVQIVPTVLFADAKGELLGDAILGSELQAWRDTMEQLLNGEEGK